jgi:DNA-binding response OmpR family regulator
MRILFIEDNLELAEPLADALKEKRYTIDLAADGQQGWELVQATTYDLILMDVMLPKIDGITLCRRIRAGGDQVPILMLTAKKDVSEQIRGLDSGADDYVIKPVGINVLAARIRALLRRRSLEIAPILKWGNLQLDPSQYEVSYQGVKIPVTPKEFALLELMLRNSHQVLNRKTILETLWSDEEDTPEEDTIKAHIRGIRQKLRAFDAHDLIETVYGLGYRFNLKYLQNSSQQKPGLR